MTSDINTVETAPSVTKGYCLCQKTTWAFTGEMSWQCYCHCDDCRRNCGAPVVGWIGVPLKNFTWTGQKPSTFESSKGVYRHFCGDCGSPMGFEADHYPGGMHIYAGSLQKPELFQPRFHVNYASKLPGLALHDDLTKYDTTLLHTPADPQGYE